MAAYQKNWARKNRERVKAVKRKHYLKNIERYRENRKKWYERNRSKVKAYQHEYREKNREKVNARDEKARLMRRYGLGRDQLHLFLKKRNEKCPVCLRKSKKVLAFDHCHRTGVLRGLICGKCNSAIAFLDEDPVIMRRLADYVSKSALFSLKVA